MSRGHWDYEGFRCFEHLDNVGSDGELIQRMPKLCQVFRDLSKVMRDIEYVLDGDLSGDSGIENDEKFELRSLDRFNETINKKAKFKIYESESYKPLRGS